MDKVGGKWKCAICGAETVLLVRGVPRCLACNQKKARIDEKRAEKKRKPYTKT